MKLCMSVGFVKVNVVFVFRVTNTLFELIVAFPDWYKGAKLPVPGPGGVGVGVGVGMGAGVGAGAGILEAQTDGCPEQLQLF